LKEKENLKLSDRLMCQVNFAQTYKWLGENKEAIKVLKSLDFSLAPSQYLFSKSLIEDNYQDSSFYLRKLINEKEPSESPDGIIHFYSTWPIAKTFVETEEFAQLLNEYDLDRSFLEPYKEVEEKSVEEDVKLEFGEVEKYNKKRTHVRRGVYYDRRTKSNTRCTIKNRRKEKRKERKRKKIRYFG